MAGHLTVPLGEGGAEAGDAMAAAAREITERLRANGDGLVRILEEVQDTCGYLPEAALRAVAETAGQSLVDVYGEATFYRSFSLTPRGKHLISVCLGTACHVRGAPTVAEEFQRQLGIEPEETTQDNEFTLETVNCLGACALGPIVVADGHYFSNVRAARVAEIIETAREGVDKLPAGADERVFPIEVNCSRCNHSLMDPTRPVGGLPSIRVTVGFQARRGALALSSLYGSDQAVVEAEIPTEAVVAFFCPHCCGELAGTSRCVECGAPVAPMIVQGGGVLQVCMRRGCMARRLDLNGADV
jgi:NADH-quinone oxidoreductase subunit E